MPTKRQRITVNLADEEAAALQAHPDYTGSLGGTLRLLALRAAGLEPADSYANHRARARDEKGRIMSWTDFLKQAFDSYYQASGKDQQSLFQQLCHDIGTAPNATRLAQVLTPVLATAAKDREALAEVLLRLKGPDWEDVQSLALLANAAR